MKTPLGYLAMLVSLCLASQGQAKHPQEQTYEDVQAFLREVAASFPETSKLFTLGRSDSGDRIEGLQVGSGPTNSLVVATHHGNEYSATEVAKAFAAGLAAAPIATQTVYIVPVLNIPGYNAKRRHEIAGGVRWDPNRNYPGPCGSEGPLTLRSTAALADFLAKENIVVAATLHAYAPAVVYPWGLASWDRATPYESIFKELVASATCESQYPTGNASDVIYPANGTFEDYAYWKHGIWALLFEVGESFSPDQGELEETVRTNVIGLRKMLEGAPQHQAVDHQFTGTCDASLHSLDRHDE